MEPEPQEPGELEELAEPASDPSETEEAPPETQARYRALFETQLHQLPDDQRAQQAVMALEPELSAFCFDPVPAVIRALGCEGLRTMLIS